MQTMAYEIARTTLDILVLDHGTQVTGHPTLALTLDPATRAIIAWRLTVERPPSGAALDAPTNPKPRPETLLLDNSVFAPCDLSDALLCEAQPAPVPVAKDTVVAAIGPTEKYTIDRPGHRPTLLSARLIVLFTPRMWPESEISRTGPPQIGGADYTSDRLIGRP
jgi:hypothetical protein